MPVSISGSRQAQFKPPSRRGAVQEICTWQELQSGECGDWTGFVRKGTRQPIYFSIRQGTGVVW